MRNCWSSRFILSACLAGGALLAVGCGKTASDDTTTDADMGAGGAGGESTGGAGGEVTGGTAGGAGGEATGGTTGGAGGEATGGAGGGEPPVAACGDDVQVGVLVVDGTTGSYEGQTGSSDVFFASCTPAEQPGSEGVVQFTAPIAGYWRVTTTGTVWDTVLYALEDCNDGFTELTCNNDIEAGNTRSSILLDMQEGQTVFLFVDQIGKLRESAFKLNAEKLDASPPTISEFKAYYSDVTGAAGIRVTASDPDGDITQFRWGVFGADGAQINLDQAQPELQLTFEEFPPFVVTQNEDGSISVEGSAAPQGGFPIISKMTFQLGDAEGLWGEAVEAEVAPTDVDRAHGEACDPGRALDACGEADACADPDADQNWTCETATAPTVTDSEGFYNSTTNGLGLRISGTDPENDVSFIRFQAFNAGGEEVYFGDAPGAVTLGLYQAQQLDGNFEVHFAFAPFFQGLCLPGAQAHFDDCVGNMRPEDVCIDEANGVLDMCNRETAATITRLSVELVDTTLKASPAFDINIGATPVTEAGGACDAVQAIASCPEGYACGDFAPDLGWDTCVTADSTTCPEHFGATDLTAAMGEGPWTAQGDNTDGDGHGGGSCGGGGPADVFSFTAPAAGNYNAQTGNLGQNVDSLIYVRKTCALYVEDQELGCSDDIDTQGMNFASSVDFMAEAGETVYIFVDSYNGQFPGSYRLTVSGP